MKAHTTHYALTCTGEENQEPRWFVLPSVNMKCYETPDEKWTALPVGESYHESSQKEFPLFLVRNPALCLKPQAFPSMSQCVNIAGWQCYGVWFHGTFSASWWKCMSATGYPNIRGSQKHPFIVPAHASLQIDFLYQSHAHATRPQMPSINRAWIQLTALTCSVTTSKSGYFRGWHGTNCCRTLPLNIREVPWWIRALMKQYAVQGSSQWLEGATISVLQRIASKHPEPLQHLDPSTSLHYITPLAKCAWWSFWVTSMENPFGKYF